MRKGEGDQKCFPQESRGGGGGGGGGMSAFGAVCLCLHTLLAYSILCCMNTVKGVLCPLPPLGETQNQGRRVHVSPQHLSFLLQCVLCLEAETFEGKYPAIHRKINRKTWLLASKICCIWI